MTRNTSIITIPKYRPEFASLIPYMRDNDVWKFYLQRRDRHAREYPEWLGPFGGHIEEGENPEEAMLREIQEELSITPQNYRHFHDYHLFEKSGYVFITEVTADFEQTVQVREGQYGRFYTITDLKHEQVMYWAMEALGELERYLSK